MSFSSKEQDFIEFGKIIIFTSMAEMQHDKDDLNTIQFDYLIDKALRDIVDKDLFEDIIKSVDLREDEPKDWREGNE
jgi:Zn-dependent M16 (insulinase) family peptidase